MVAIDKPEKYEEAIAVLAAMIFVHSLEKVPIVVLANKIDINKDNFDVNQLDFSNLTTGTHYEIMKCSALTGEGISEAFEVISSACDIIKNRKEERKVLFLGSSGAGKTTLWNHLVTGSLIPTEPSIGFNVETIEHKDLKIDFWDIKGT